MEKLKKYKGITLILFVITIIILLILAGITIAQLSNSGLFSKAQEAKEKSENAQEKEETEIAKLNNEVDMYSSRLTNQSSTLNYDLLWSGTYSTNVASNDKQTTGGCKLYEGKNIEDYKMILIMSYAHGTNDFKDYSSQLIPVDLITEQYGYPSCRVGFRATNTYASYYDVGFIDANTFYIAWRDVSDCEPSYVNRIYGIK